MVRRVQEEKQPTCVSNHTGAGVTSEKTVFWAARAYARNQLFYIIEYISAVINLTYNS